MGNRGNLDTLIFAYNLSHKTLRWIHTHRRTETDADTQRVDRQGIRETKARERAIATTACAATSNKNMHAIAQHQWHATSCGEWHATSARQGLVNATIGLVARAWGLSSGVCSRGQEPRLSQLRLSSPPTPPVSPLPSLLSPDTSRQSIANHYWLPYPTDAAAHATFAVTQIVTKKLTRGLA